MVRKTTSRKKAGSSDTPLPGKPVVGSDSGRPIMAALNMLSRRWVLRIIWELRKEARGFRELQSHCDRMSPDTLSTRLIELREAGIVEHDPDGNWALTPLGMEMKPALKALVDWSELWAESVSQSEK